MKNIKGFRFGRLTVENVVGKDTRGEYLWRCICDCGVVISVRGGDLRSGNTNSCGCFMRDQLSAATTLHGHARSSIRGGIQLQKRTPEFIAYVNAKQRCTDPRSRSYKNYGARGIAFLFESYAQWFKELGQKPSRNHSVNRINNDGHYEPGNVEWATASQQALNKRRKVA